jgi:hypothetical protein
MAEESEERGDTKNGKEVASSHEEDDSGDDEMEATDSEADEDEEEEEDDEPKLKYARLTSSLGPLYRNGDATSAFVVAGEKMVGQRMLLVEFLLNLVVHWNT